MEPDGIGKRWLELFVSKPYGIFQELTAMSRWSNASLKLRRGTAHMHKRGLSGNNISSPIRQAGSTLVSFISRFTIGDVSALSAGWFAGAVSRLLSNVKGPDERLQAAVWCGRPHTIEPCPDFVRLEWAVGSAEVQLIAICLVG